jgi:hypothetical protein
MPAISADTVALPRVPEPDPTAADRPVVSMTTAPAGGDFITDGDTQWMTAGAELSVC